MVFFLLILECLKELFLIVLVGALVAFLSATLLIYILVKIFGLDEIMNIEDVKNEDEDEDEEER